MMTDAGCWMVRTRFMVLIIFFREILFRIKNPVSSIQHPASSIQDLLIKNKKVI
jgi:hypothetical protein